MWTTQAAWERCRNITRTQQVRDHLACTEGTDGEAKTLGGAAPPARPRERKTPDNGFIFIQQNNLAPLGAVLQSGQFARRPRQVSRGRSEASCGGGCS